MFQLKHQVKLRKQKHNFMNKPVHMSDTHTFSTDMIPDLEPAALISTKQDY